MPIQAVEERYEVWRTVLFDRAGEPCDLCRPLEGKVWLEGKGPQPPLHPRCRCRREHFRTTYRIEAMDLSPTGP